MNGLDFVLLEIASATLTFVLVRFMIKPYQYTGEGRYVGLPLGFSFLGVSYIFMAVALRLGDSSFAEELKWLHIFTQAYAFAFLAVTYFFSRRPFKQNTRVLWLLLFSLLLVGLFSSYLIVVVHPLFLLPSYKVVDEYFRGFNIILASYVSVYTLRSHAFKPDPKTILAPLGYIFLAFSQYSSLIWSLDASSSALLGAYIIRLAGLVIFLFVSYQAFGSPARHQSENRD